MTLIECRPLGKPGEGFFLSSKSVGSWSRGLLLRKLVVGIHDEI